MPESPSPHLRDMLPMTAEGADPRLFSSRQALAGLSAVGGSGAVSPDDDDLEVHLKYKGQVYPVTMNQHTEAMEVRRPCHCRLQSAVCSWHHVDPTSIAGCATPRAAAAWDEARDLEFHHMAR